MTHLRQDSDFDATDEMLPIGPPETPERAMLTALLLLGIRDLESRYPHERVAARAWIFGQDLGGQGFAFVTVCEILDLDPDQVRELVRARKRGVLLARGPGALQRAA